MSDPFLVIVSGPPATGKTAIARMIAAELRLRYLGKDEIKEILFETLGWSDRAWSKKLGAATYEVLFLVIGELLRAGLAIVIESDFRAEETGERFRALQKQHGYRAVQILLRSRGDVLLDRHFRRETSGDRHPGHRGGPSSPSGIQELLKGSYEPLPIAGDVIEVDTTDFNLVDLPSLVSRIKRIMARSSSSPDMT